MKSRRLALYTVFGLVAVLVLGLVILFTIDLGRFKPQIESIVSDATGRDFSIRGGFAPTLGRTLRIVAEDVHIAATDWSDYEDLVSLRKLDIEIDAWSLISGPVEIDSVYLDGVRIHLQQYDAEKNNWTLFETDSDDGSSKTSDARPTLPVVVNKAEVTDLQLTYDGPDRDEPLTFTAARLSEIKLATEDLAFSLEGLLNETDVMLEAQIGPVQKLIEYREVEFDLEASVGEISVVGNGRIDDLLTPSRPEARFELSGPSVAYLFQVLHEEPVTDGPLSFQASIMPDGDDMRVDISGVFGEFGQRVTGRFVNLQELRNIELALEADGPDVGTLIRMVNRQYADKDPFDMKARLHRDGAQLTIDEVSINIGETRLQMEGSFADFPNPGNAEARIHASGPDFGRFNRLIGLPGRLAGPFTMDATLQQLPNGRSAVKVESKARDFTLEANAETTSATGYLGSRATVHISGDDISVVAAAAGLGEAPAETFDISGSMERIRAGTVLHDFLVVIGDDRFGLDGIVGDEPLKEMTDLRFDIIGTDIADTLRAFRVKGDRLPRGEFRAVGRVHREDDHFVLENVQASIGDDQAYLVSAAGTLTDAPGLRGSELQVGVRGGSLAAIADLVGIDGIPDVDYDVRATVLRLERAYRISDGNVQLGTVSGTLSGSVGDNPMNRDTDLLLRLNVPDLAYSLGRFGLDVARVPAEALTIQGRVRNRSERLQVDELQLNYAGMDAIVDGAIGEPPLLEGTQLDLRLSGPNLSRLLPDMRQFSALDKAFTANTEFAVTNGLASLTGLRVKLGNTSLNGEVSAATSPLFSSGSFDLTANSPDLFALMPRLADIAVPQEAPMQFSGAGRWQERYWEFDDVDLQLGKGSIRLSGTIDGPPDFDRTDFEFDWHVSSVGNYSVLLGRELPDHSAHLRARLTGTPSEMVMEEFIGKIGDSDISGDFRMRAGDVPHVHVQFTSDRLNLAPYLPPLEDSEEENVPADGRVIPDTPLPLDFLASFDADIDVTIDQLIGRALTVDDFDIDGSIADGDLFINNFSLTGQRGGTLAMQMRLENNDEGAADFAMSAKGSDLILGLHAATIDDLALLPLYEISMDATGHGATLRDLAATLDGDLRMVGGEGKITAGGLSMITGDVFDQVLSAVNPFVETDPYTNVACSAVLLQFNDGVVTGQPALVQKTDKLLLLANARINLADERLRIEFNSVPQRGIGISLSRLVTPYVQLTGTMARPRLSLDPEGTLIEGGVAVATGGLSILAKSFRDRFFSSRDPCGDAVERHDEAVAAAVE